MDFAAYRALRATNWSSLKHARRSLLHFHFMEEQGGAAETRPMILGGAGHVSILEPDEFPLRYYVVTPEQLADLCPPRNTREGRETWRDYLERHPGQEEVDSAGYQRLILEEVFAGKVALTRAAYDSCLGMRNSVRRHPMARGLLEAGKAEQVIRWVDERTRTPMKARIDWRRAPWIPVELKTTRSIDLHRFADAAEGLGYFHQVAFYRRGLAAVEGCSRGAIAPHVIAVENTAPHDVLVGEVPGESLDEADEEIDKLLSAVAEARKTGVWPGRYENKVETLRRPAWTQARIEDVEMLETDAADAAPMEMEG